MKTQNRKLRLQKEKSGFQFKRVFYILLPFIFIGIIIQLINYSKHDPYFNIETIEVEGNIYLESTEIILASKLFKGLNINTFRNKDITDNIVALPRIKYSQVIKRHPNKVIIKVKEINQIALFRDSTGISELTEIGKIFPVKHGVTEFDKPIITGLESNSEEFRLESWNFIKFIDSLENNTGLFDIISEINFSEEHFIKVILRTGKTALLRRDKFELDLKRLEIVLRSFNLEDRKVIDLRFAKRVYLRNKI